MKIKRFFSKDMREGIRQVREALGADAVILSNTPVRGGIEIVAAIDYDESLLTADTSFPAADTTRSTAPSSREAAPKQSAQAKAFDSFQDSDFELEDDMVSIRSSFYSDEAKGGEAPKSEIPPSAFTDAPAEKGTEHVTKEAVEPASRHIEWSQDPALVAMRHELEEMRGLLEQQMAGLAWGVLSHRDPQRAKLIRCLLELGLSPKLCQRLVESIKPAENFDTAWRQVVTLLAKSLPIDSSDELDKGGVVALVGATGVGKTTTIAKLAARYALKHGRDRVALVTTDSYRIAAHEQLRTYGRILGIPVKVANNKEELTEVLKLFSEKDLVLIDTAGMSQRDVRLSQQFSLIKDSAPSIKTYLVFSTTTHRAGLNEIIQAFGEVKLDGCILTKLDETTSLGGALSMAVEHKLPVTYVSDGQKVPEDIHIARSHNLIHRAVLVAQQANQALEQESLTLAFTGMVANAHG
jgi:flagellar biosynthesis protein FlhF